MASKCRDCEHFEPEEADAWSVRYDAEHPERKPRSDWGACSETLNYSPEPSATTLAVDIDGSGYHAVLMVSPDFGCVMFKKAAA